MGIEDITVHHAPLDGLMAWLERQQALGAVIDLKVYCALAFCGENRGGSL